MLRLSGKNINWFNIPCLKYCIYEVNPERKHACWNWSRQQFQTKSQVYLTTSDREGIEHPDASELADSSGTSPSPLNTPYFPLPTPHPRLPHLSEQVLRCPLQLQLPIACSWLLSLFIVLNLKITEFPPFRPPSSPPLSSSAFSGWSGMTPHFHTPMQAGVALSF